MTVLPRAIALLDTEPMEPSRRASSLAGRPDDADRARLTLLLVLADTPAMIREILDCKDSFTAR